MRKIVVFLAVGGVLVGCGGSGSGETSNQVRSANNSKIDPNIVAVSGVYDTSRTLDEAYLYISDAGRVTVYDYQGDVSGTGDNCYSLATTSNQINSIFNTGKVSYSTSTGKYTLTGDSDVLEFTYDTTDGMQNFTLNSAISSNTGLDMSAMNLNIKIGGDGSLQSTLLISDIESAICN
ncbi:MAG: hypothetical protein C9356_07765 [Oleiphilus sp.]|nr:MAG: hypothetical protein C9356_07765 [Oleiphilus sp.]